MVLNLLISFTHGDVGHVGQRLVHCNITKPILTGFQLFPVPIA